jgi:hypothetical protein
MGGARPRVPGPLGWLALSLFIPAIIAIGVAGISAGMLVVDRNSGAIGRTVVAFLVGSVLVYGACGLYYLALRRRGLVRRPQTTEERAAVKARTLSALPWIGVEAVVIPAGITLLVILALNVRGIEGLVLGSIVLGASAMLAVLAQVEVSRRLRPQRPFPGGLKPRTVRLVVVVGLGIFLVLNAAQLITHRFGH